MDEGIFPRSFSARSFPVLKMKPARAALALSLISGRPQIRFFEVCSGFGRAKEAADVFGRP
jgi:hypothetical protein